MPLSIMKLYESHLKELKACKIKQDTLTQYYLDLVDKIISCWEVVIFSIDSIVLYSSSQEKVMTCLMFPVKWTLKHTISRADVLANKLATLQFTFIITQYMYLIKDLNCQQVHNKKGTVDIKHMFFQVVIYLS